MPRHNYIALGASLLLHVGVPALFLAAWGNAISPAPVKIVPITLNMFQTAPAPVVVAQAKPVKPAPVVQSRPKPKAKPKPKPKPKVKPKPKPKPKVKAIPKLPEPEPILEPVVEPVMVEPEPVYEVYHPPVPEIIEVSRETKVIEQAVATADSVAPVAADPGALALIEANYQNQLRQLIEEKKVYPIRAKRTRREGTVFISFVILPDGTIESVAFNQKSGVPSLDRAAKKLILSISGALPFPSEIQRGRWTFTLPIGFELL